MLRIIGVTGSSRISEVGEFKKQLKSIMLAMDEERTENMASLDISSKNS
jgi:hypothetical protein